MNVIDHAILIPASPEFIWRFLGDITQNTNWQDDCMNISFLTTQHEGKGTRWRYSTSKGKDVIVEITAWYDTLGYEYTIVDGSSVDVNQGRVRLQEIAEGTLVQWTFNYEVNGMLSGLRNSISLKRSLTNNIQDSLRNLYKLVQQETGGISTHEARSSLKEAPDVEQRSNYQPRHPSNFAEDNITGDTYPESEYPSEHAIQYSMTDGIPEPPVTDDDTKPNPLVQSTSEMEKLTLQSNSPEQINEPQIADDDTKPNAPIVESEISTGISESKDGPDTSISEIEQDISETTTPDIRDTSRISVFDVFGLQKPSETQNIKVITPDDLEAAQAKELETSVTETDATSQEAQLEVEDIVDGKSSTISDEEAVEKPSIEPETSVEDHTLNSEISSDDRGELKQIGEVMVADSDTATETISVESSTSILGYRIKSRREMIDLKRRNLI